ncbi:enolase C-terminal domain-like protein [Microbacterium ulmi]|uniref:Starvation-sensing protein RspA n=1 Tax=Microbacterium ulmi TaxID=179095 RepID=A0A7Y2M2E5_9MICO|nr:enolase C-terminal domain-like protein [Microbacterium ulmi]NII69923.1 mannonate dehydratase [Microbacterium ulmi]NNH03843.1 starvation-sensing protein RspA [Microbacterium ulmi]
MTDDTAQPHPAFAAPWASREDVRITSVRAIATAPDGTALVVVRIDTNVPGLYGLGCATFTQRWKAVKTFVEEHLARLLIGRYPGDINDLVRLAAFSGYWRGGPVTNNAISGIDQALWDIAGKRAGLPVYELLGGKVRAAADTYLHASGRTPSEAIDHAHELVAQGLRHIRLQISTPGGGGYGAPAVPTEYPDAPYGNGWSARDYLRRTPALFEAARSALPYHIELLHDVHSRLTPKDAVWLARALEPYRLFFLEDVLPPEHWDRLPEVRAASPVPIAVGELTTSLTDAVRLVRDGGVDFIRCHVSDIGGLTPARKIADLAELTGVKTAWHGPGDTSPIGAAANVALDVTSAAFGIQEGHVYSEATHEVFPGTLRIIDGWLTPNDAPGWGIDLDEAAAARHPADLSGHDEWAAGVRRPDGALEAP